MDLVLDANVLFSALIRQNSTFNLVLHEDIHLYAPEFILVELAKYKDLIIEKTGRSEKDFQAVLDLLSKYIRCIPMDDFVTFLREAEEISPDPKDVTYLALALKLKVPIWSNDKDLQTRQNIVKIMSTKDVLERLAT